MQRARRAAWAAAACLVVCAAALCAAADAADPGDAVDAPAAAHALLAAHGARGVVTTRQCGGLYNQYAAVVGVLALARELSLVAVLPPAASRRTMVRGAGDSWFELPMRELFDVAHLRAALPDAAMLFDGAPAPDGDGELVAALVAACGEPVRVPRVYGRASGYYGALVDAALDARPPANASASADAALVHLRLPCAQFLYAPQTRDEQDYVERVERALLFSPALRADARAVVRALGGAASYSGFHMRCEQDARSAWAIDCASPRVYAAPLAGVDPRAPLYVATAEPALARFIDARFRVVTHASFGLTAQRYNGSLEHLAAVDALVLHYAAHFVGFSVSSFSFFVARWRPPGAPSHVERIASEATHAIFTAAFPPLAPAAGGWDARPGAARRAPRYSG